MKAIDWVLHTHHHRDQCQGDERLIETVFLRVLNNKVSDGCVVETMDHVSVTLRYSMRVNFEGEPNTWFNVENYVKFLTDHLRSLIRAAIKTYRTSFDIVASPNSLLMIGRSMQKLGVRRQLDAVLAAAQAGMIELPS